jgi:hypothetical protein
MELKSTYSIDISLLVYIDLWLMNVWLQMGYEWKEIFHEENGKGGVDIIFVNLEELMLFDGYEMLRTGFVIWTIIHLRLHNGNEIHTCRTSSRSRTQNRAENNCRDEHKCQ